MGIQVRKKAPSTFQVRQKYNDTYQVTSSGGSIKSLEDIGDVDELSVVEGATVVYNSSTDKYEIKKLDPDDLDGDFNLDCGEF